MLALKPNITFKDCDCNLTVTDVTGYNSIMNDGKFIKEGLILPSNKDYRLSDGILFNVIYTEDKNKINVLNDTFQFPALKPSSQIDSIDYSKNITPYNHIITVDGLYYILNVFVMSKTFYTANAFRYPTGEPVMYFDSANNKLVFVDNGEELDIRSYKDLIYFLHTTNVESIYGLVLNEELQFSICNIIHCYTQLLHSYLDDSLGYDEKKNRFKCPNGKCLEDTSAKDDIDFLRNAIAALKYLLECENYEDAQRIVNLMGQCSSICSKYKINKSINNDCGC